MAAALLPVTSKGDCVSQHLMFFLVTLLQRVKEPGSLGGCISHPGRDRRHLFRKRADFDTFCLDGLHPLVVNCYHGLIQWIIGDLNASPGKCRTGLIHMAFERKASCLVDGAVLMMQECFAHNFHVVEDEIPAVTVPLLQRGDPSIRKLDILVVFP